MTHIDVLEPIGDEGGVGAVARIVAATVAVAQRVVLLALRTRPAELYRRMVS